MGIFGLSYPWAKGVRTVAHDGLNKWQLPGPVTLDSGPPSGVANPNAFPTKESLKCQISPSPKLRRSFSAPSRT